MACTCSSNPDYAQQMEDYLSFSGSHTENVTLVDERSGSTQLPRVATATGDYNSDEARKSDGPKDVACPTSETIFPVTPKVPGSFNTTTNEEFDFGLNIEDLFGPQELRTPTTETHDGNLVMGSSPFSLEDQEVPGFKQIFSPLAFEETGGSLKVPHHKTSSSTFPTLMDGFAHNSCLCFKQGLKILRSMYADLTPHMCIFSERLDHGNGAPRMIDEALSLNATAMHIISETLDCQYRCVDSPALQVIVIVIFDRLVSWNQATLAASGTNPRSSSAINKHKPAAQQDTSMGGLYECTSSVSPADSASRGPPNADEGKDTAKDRVTLQPFRVGNHRLDDETAERLTASLVLHELSHLENLINCFHVTRCEQTPRARTSIGLLDLVRRRIHAIKKVAARKAIG